ncbi:MAG: agmatine deiminase family protein, partial [Candidatus Cloacimonetes bacterium]|nr:agmatine deiminase family protein [Candidatus Cloacimonadota bacterium]
MKRILSALLLSLLLSAVYAVNSDLIDRTEHWYEDNPGILPHWMTPEEVTRRDEIGRNFQETPPPVAPVRAIAEFEQMTAVMVRYPLGIPVALVAELSQEIEIITVVSAAQQNSCNNTFINNGVNMANITYLNATTDSYWTRDYGPWFIMDGNDELGVVDFVYNRPRPNDDEIPITFANTYQLNLFGMNLEQTGGNYMCDGLGSAAQTQLVYEENGNNQTNVNNLMEDYLGITNYFVVDDPNNTYIDHIDCWGKFLAVDKVLIRSVPQSHSQYDEIEAVANFFATQNCGWGYPYQVFRVNTPNNQPYTNSLIINNRVFLPIMGDSYDNAAVQAYQNAMPGYEIFPFTHNSTSGWESTDALHCRTHELADEGMLYIQHIPYHGELPYDSDITFEAYIYPYSGSPLYSDSLFIEIAINNQPVRELLPLIHTTGNLYETQPYTLIPGAEYAYSVHAADQSGRAANQPVMGMIDPHTFTTEPDQIAPVIVHTPIENSLDSELPITISATVTDNYGVMNVEMVYSINDGAEEYLTLSAQGADLFNGEFNVQMMETYTVTYKIMATDGINEAYFPSDRWYTFLVQTTFSEESIQPLIVNAFDNIYPSPANLSTDSITIKYSSNSMPMFDVYNVKGQKVAQFSGSYGKNESTVHWNLRNSENEKVA